MPAPKKKEEELEKFWFPNDAEGYVLGEVLHKDESDNMHVKLHLPDGETKTSNFHATVTKPPSPIKEYAQTDMESIEKEPGSS